MQEKSSTIFTQKKLDIRAGPLKSQVKKGLKKFKKKIDQWKRVCYNVFVMSENAYLTKPTHQDVRETLAGVEGSLEFIIDNINTEWCENDDIHRILSDAVKTLENARETSRDAESA